MFQSSLLPRSLKAEVLTAERLCAVTENAQEKTSKKQETGKAEADPLESVFSAHCLPKEFYQDFLCAHSCQAWVDLACGQGESAKACLLERKAFFGVTLSEAHSKRLEVALTTFLLEEFTKEGSTYYRAEAVGVAAASAQTNSTHAEAKPMVKKPKRNDKKKKEGEVAGLRGEPKLMSFNSHFVCAGLIS